MTKRLELYHCTICGNIIEVLHEGIGELYCCGAPMELLQAKTHDEMAEKHVPIIEEHSDDNIKIKVGSIPHPMEKEHYITFIEAISEDNKCVHLKFLEPHDQPEMILKHDNKKYHAREYCNIHGLWANE